MIYPLDEGDPGYIEETKFGVGRNITFKTFTSCIGVIGKTRDEVIGIHLVQFTTQAGDHFNKAAAWRVFELLNSKGALTKDASDGRPVVAIIGHPHVWGGDAVDANVKEGYNTLTQLLRCYVQMPDRGGVFSAQIGGGVVTVSHEGGQAVELFDLQGEGDAVTRF